MADDKQYIYDQFSEFPDKTSSELHKEKVQKFVTDYATQLSDIENALDETFGEVWDPVQDPVAVDLAPYEDQHVSLLLRTDNKLLRKILLVFSALSFEIQDLKEIAEKRFYPSLSMFGEHEDGEEMPEGELPVQFGRMFHLLQDVWNFTERACNVIQNAVRQLASLYCTPIRGRRLPHHCIAFDKVHLQPFFASIADLLGVLVTLDEIITQNPSFTNAASIFRRMLRTIKSDPARFGTDENTVKRFEFLLQHIEGDILDGLVLQNCVERDFEDPINQIEVKTNQRFRDEFFANIKYLFLTLSAKIGDPTECDRRNQLMGFAGLYTLYFHIFRDLEDKKFVRQVWDLHKKVPVIHLHGNISWSLADFLMKKVPALVKTMNLRDPAKDALDAKKECNKIIDESFHNQVQVLFVNLCNWMVRMESNFVPMQEGDAPEIVILQSRLVLYGVQLAYQINHLLKSTIFLHLNLDVPLSSKHAISMSKCVEMLKSIRYTFHRRCAVLALYTNPMHELISFKIQRILMPFLNKLESMKSLDDSQIDQLSAVLLVNRMLSGPPTPHRLTIAKLALNVAFQKTQGLIREQDCEEVKAQLRRLELLATVPRLLEQACDCNVIYFSRPMIHTFFKHVFEHPTQAQKLQYLFAALHDCEPLLRSCIHLQDPAKMFQSFKQEVMSSFEEHVITPLNQAIETDLRLHIHSVVLGQNATSLGAIGSSSGSSSKDKTTQVRDLGRFLRIRPIRFFGEFIDVAARVTHYLDTTFYNLTTIAMHDWKTYEEMRNLATEKYGLVLTDVHLPGQTLEQGLDVLEITRNIHIFVSRYSYNMNTQTFIERTTSTDAKNLNSIHIRHISNSIRTHGTGIMNTTVNFVYQFLGKKFFIFSQFLYDDHVKSRLIKDMRFFKDEKDALGNKFPMKRAEAFQKYIKKLGLTDAGLSYLDQFRVLITEIGNALGYVRMVRSGGLRYISNAIKFVPDLEHITEFEELAKKDGLSAETVAAAKNLDSVIANLSQKFAEGSDYFKALVQVFSMELLKDQNQHLRNFYIIVPALTVSYVESMLIAKDRLFKKGKEANFTDDGFALGCTFILKVLNQNTIFDSLHWFESVNDTYDQETQRIREQMELKKRSSQDELQTLKLKQTTINQFRTEFELLFFSFNSAKVFFRE